MVRTADSRKTFSKGVSANWSERLYKNFEFFNVTIPSYKINQNHGNYNEALLKKTQLTMKENDSFLKNLNITEIKSKFFYPSLLTLTNLFVNNKACPLISIGTTPSNINSTLIGWEAVKNS